MSDYQQALERLKRAHELNEQAEQYRQFTRDLVRRSITGLRESCNHQYPRHKTIGYMETVYICSNCGGRV